MKPLFADTSPEAERVLIEGYRRMTPEEKLACIADLNEMIERLQESRLREAYGVNISEREVSLRLAALRLPRDIMVSVFGWDPDKKGY